VEGIDTDAYERSGQLVCVKSEDLLTKFVSDGVLDGGLFKSTIAGLIDQARACSNDGRARKVRVFGEMVSQLRGTNMKATTLLEKLWNEVIKEHNVPLLCTYALHGAGDHIPKVLMDLHSDNIERETAAP